MARNPRNLEPSPLPGSLPTSEDAEERRKFLEAFHADRPQPDSNLLLPKVHRILIVDDEPKLRDICRTALQNGPIQCEEAADGLHALQAISERPFDLILLDMAMPRLNGEETLKRIRQSPTWPNLKVIVFSGHMPGDEMAALLSHGADDFVPKPYSVAQLRARVNAALRLKQAQDRSDLLNHRLSGVNYELEKALGLKDEHLISARNGLVLALAKLVEYRSLETGTHLLRLQKFCRALGDEAKKMSEFNLVVDENFVQTLVACVPLHDIGKVALADHILLKPGKLTDEERIQMQSHTIVGAQTLQSVAAEYGFAAGFLQMAIDIARYHHERFDGMGYPDRLHGHTIPLAARIVAVADVYDALRSRRVYKLPITHANAKDHILTQSPGHFDPAVLRLFERCSDEFERIFQVAGD
ncbi:response regulator [Telmatocola sphagniphila]|uniref:Response regulator n=1 Tax=Telmatocola sphagniphila TaxID=1123043 RepID=A0A8E6ETY5_9BACT|nr:response regulator [Telmatocola sphagniphila]QVL30562.1 response regulator [Telmatocola sphagniphila]